jgi:hypothetical protein
MVVGRIVAFKSFQAGREGRREEAGAAGFTRFSR